MSRNAVAHRVLYGIDAHTCGNGIELANGAVIYVIVTEKVSVGADMAFRGNAVVAQLHIFAEAAVRNYAAGVNERLFGKYFCEIQHIVYSLVDITAVVLSIFLEYDIGGIFALV